MPFEQRGFIIVPKLVRYRGFLGVFLPEGAPQFSLLLRQTRDSDELFQLRLPINLITRFLYLTLHIYGENFTFNRKNGPDSWLSKMIEIIETMCSEPILLR